jgi:hypothetical protein
MFDVFHSHAMPDRARVTSLEAIETFRAKLIIYRDKAGRVLDEVSDEVIRTRLWLENDRIAHWQNEIKRRTRELETRRQELFSAQLSGLREASYVQQQAVVKAKQALRDAEERLQSVKQWSRQYDQRVEPLARHVDKLRHTLGNDMGLAVASLAELLKTLAAYAELSHTTASSPPTPGESNVESQRSTGPASGGGPA